MAGWLSENPKYRSLKKQRFAGSLGSMFQTPMRFHIALVCVLFVLTWHEVACAASPKIKPNILLILADDLGYECLGVNGGESYKTPNLDKLAAGGMRFDHAYAQPLCTPTRVQLMTGQSNVRNYVGFGKLDPKSPTFANILQKAGYKTAMVGKWQLGKNPDQPRQAGFDEHLLWQHTLPRMDTEKADTRYGNPILERDGQPIDAPEGSYGPDLTLEFACDFISRHKNGPFLLYYSDILPHCPLVPTPDSREWALSNGRSKNYKGDLQYFDDMVAHMDKNVGRLVAKLDELGIRDNTLVIFLGDNGCDAPVVSRWRGKEIKAGKGKTTRAGMHVPFIANWPGVIPVESVCKELVDTTDFVPTLCEAAAAPLPKEVPFDGISFLPILRGEKGQPRDWIYSWYSATLATVHESAFDKRFKLYTDGRFYDMDADPLEQTPLDDAKLDVTALAAKAKLSDALNRFNDARSERLKRLSKKLLKLLPKPKLQNEMDCVVQIVTYTNSSNASFNS
jgi:arylsulfatase A